MVCVMCVEAPQISNIPTRQKPISTPQRNRLPLIALIIATCPTFRAHPYPAPRETNGGSLKARVRRFLQERILHPIDHLSRHLVCFTQMSRTDTVSQFRLFVFCGNLNVSERRSFFQGGGNINIGAEATGRMCSIPFFVDWGKLR